MHYLVTGGAGFIGSHLCDALIAAGHRVRVVDNLSTGHRANLHPSVELLEGDCCDAALMREALKDVDGVFHLAAVASVQKSREAWVETSQINQTVLIGLFEVISKMPKPIPVVYASSAAVYGDPAPEQMPLAESVPLVPLTPYGADKAGCELHARVASHVFGIPTLGLRFFNVYGPRQDPSSPYSGVISIFIDRICSGQPIRIFGDGGQTRDFIYVADVVAHLVAAQAHLEQHGCIAELALNVCSGQSVSINELAALIAEISGQTLQKTHEPARLGDIRTSLGKPDKARVLLGVKAGISLKIGLKQTIESFQSAASPFLNQTRL